MHDWLTVILDCCLWSSLQIFINCWTKNRCRTLKTDMSRAADWYLAPKMKPTHTGSGNPHLPQSVFFFFLLHWSQLVNIQLECTSKLSFDISNWSYLLAIPKIWCHLSSSSSSSSSSLPSNYLEVQKVFYSAHLSSSAPAHTHAQFFLCHPLTSMISAKDIIYSLARRPLLACNHRVPVHRQHTMDSYILSSH